MKSSDIKEIRDRIIEGMKISAQKFLQKKKLQNGKVIISSNGVIQVIDAEEIE